MPRTQLLGIVDYINGHFTGEIKLKAIAPRFGLSPSRLTRLLKKETGFNFKQLLRGKRLALSRELLGRMSVTEACFEAGFESLSHFSRLFRTRYGESPSEYRRGLFRRGLNQTLLADGEAPRQGGRHGVSLADGYHREILKIVTELKGPELERIRSWAEAGRERLERGRRVFLLSYESEGLELEALSGRHRGPSGPQGQERWYPIRKSFDPDREEFAIACPHLRGFLRPGSGDLLLTAVPCPGLACTSGASAEVVGPAGPVSGGLTSASPGRGTAWCRTMEYGLLSVPEMPMTPFGPGSSIVQLIVRSVLLAGMTGKPAGRAAGEGCWAPSVLGPLKALAENTFLIREVGVRMAEKVMAGGRLYLGGPRRSLNEFIWRGAGLMGLRPLDSGRPAEKDVALIDASAGWEPAVRRYAPLLSGRGASVVAISMGLGSMPTLTLSEAGHGPMDRLLGRHGGNGCDQEPGRTPSLEGRILSYVLIWMLFASYLQEMIARGHVPLVFRGFHVRGGKKYNEAAYPLCLERGY